MYIRIDTPDDTLHTWGGATIISLDGIPTSMCAESYLRCQPEYTYNIIVKYMWLKIKFDKIKFFKVWDFVLVHNSAEHLSHLYINFFTEFGQIILMCGAHRK